MSAHLILLQRATPTIVRLKYVSWSVLILLLVFSMGLTTILTEGADDSVRKVIYLAIQSAIEKMEYADPELAAGDEPFYYRVR